jgi:hypothetical protein
MKLLLSVILVFGIGMLFFIKNAYGHPVICSLILVPFVIFVWVAEYRFNKKHGIT